jgi:hypothetical protein
MQVYPGYTIEKIENELSFREIEELSKHWDDFSTTHGNLKTLMHIVGGYLGVDFNLAKKPTIEQTKESFRLLGF